MKRTLFQGDDKPFLKIMLNPKRMAKTLRMSREANNSFDMTAEYMKPMVNNYILKSAEAENLNQA